MDGNGLREILRIHTDEELRQLEEALEVEKVRRYGKPQDEHLPTLEGVIEYLEHQNDLAFLAYRRLSTGSEPGMHKDVRERLREFAYNAWQGVGDALQKAKEAAKINTKAEVVR